MFIEMKVTSLILYVGFLLVYTDGNLVGEVMIVGRNDGVSDL